MTTDAALERADQPVAGLTPADAETIVRTLGPHLVDLYATATPDDAGEEHSGWGTKQREKLLRALLDEVATNARRYRNAALSATDAAIKRFSRTNFQQGVTRSRRDRAPITRNIDKLVGGWLRQLGRRLRQDAVVAKVDGPVALRDGQRQVRLTLTLQYPWRLVANRRLTITAHFDELTPGSAPRKLPFTADPKSPSVALPESRRSYTAHDAREVEYLLRTLQVAAERSHNDELAEYAERGLLMFVPRSSAKILVAVCLPLIVFTAVASAVEWLHQRMNAFRLLPIITASCGPAPMITLRFPRAPKGGVRVEKNGVALPMKDGVAIDPHPLVGTKNKYTARGAKSFLLPYIAHITFEMPVCPPTIAAPNPSSALTGRTGTFNLTVDKTGLGDPPSALPVRGPLPLDPGHMDEHLDPFALSGCVENACRVVHFRCYFGPIDGTDVQVTVNYGDDAWVSSLHTADAVTAAKQQLTVDHKKPALVKAKVLGAVGDTYSLFAIHYYPKPGTYLVTATIGARNHPDEPYRFVKQLQRRVHVGTIATVEMTESYRLPEHHTAPSDKPAP